MSSETVDFSEKNEHFLLYRSELCLFFLSLKKQGIFKFKSVFYAGGILPIKKLFWIISKRVSNG